MINRTSNHNMSFIMLNFVVCCLIIVLHHDPNLELFYLISYIIHERERLPCVYLFLI